MEDQSLLNQNPQEVQNYLNELAIAVCVKGEQLEKYEKIIIKRFGKDLYVNMQQFAEELKHSVERGRFTNTSKINLDYLGKKAGISEETITRITAHYEGGLKEIPEEVDPPQTRDKKKAWIISLALFLVGLLFLVMIVVHAGFALLAPVFWILDIALLRGKWEVDTGISHVWRYVITGLTIFFCFLLLLIIVS